MINNGKMLLLSALLIPGVAAAQIGAGTPLGTTEADILSALTAEGYDVSEIEFEKDEIEVEAVLAGQTYEIEISPQTGLVLEIELEDDEDDD